MKQLLPLLLLVFIGCKSYNVMITEHIQVTMKDYSRDTIVSVYFEETVIDSYVHEWLLKQNNIDPKEVLLTKTIRKNRQRVYK